MENEIKLNKGNVQYLEIAGRMFAAQRLEAAGHVVWALAGKRKARYLAKALPGGNHAVYTLGASRYGTNVFPGLVMVEEAGTLSVILQPGEVPKAQPDASR